jgi:hypothetical protein
MGLWDRLKGFFIDTRRIEPTKEQPSGKGVWPADKPVRSFPPVDPSISSYSAPPFSPLVSNDDRARVFGRFSYVSAPTADNPEHIRVTDNWVRDNIIWVPIPQLKGIPGDIDKTRGPGMFFHKLAAQQLQDLWAHWEFAGLLNRVLTFDGSYVPRFVRGSRSTLSNHAFGNAFDINADWNAMGRTPASVTSRGTVRELVPIAAVHRFYWGGWYHSRPDGMHFEVARILP